MMQHPNTYWIIGVSVTYGLFLLWVWTRPNSKDENKKHISTRMELIDSLFGRWDEIEAHFKIHKNNKTLVKQLLNWCRIEVPTQLQIAFGKKCHNDYKKCVEDGFCKGKDVGAFIAAKSYLKALRVKLIE